MTTNDPKAERKKQVRAEREKYLVNLIQQRDIPLDLAQATLEALGMTEEGIGFTLWLVSKAVQVERAYLEGTRD